MSDPDQAPSVGRISARSERPRGRLPRRGAIALIVLFAAAWVVFIFAGSLARATDLDARLDDDRIRTAALKAQVDAGFAEIDFIETEAFVEHAARGIGFGTTEEEAFALPDDAPPPRPVPIVGSPSRRSVPEAPLDAWLELLFG